MATNLSIDTELLETALKTGGLKTKKDTVNLALKDYTETQKRRNSLALWYS